MCAWNPCPTKVKLFFYWNMYILMGGGLQNYSSGYVGFVGWWDLGEEERAQGTCIGLAGWMMIGGGSRGKDRVSGVDGD